MLPAGCQYAPEEGERYSAPERAEPPGLLTPAVGGTLSGPNATPGQGAKGELVNIPPPEQ